MENTLLVFAKKPQLGNVKTRLAKDIGDQKALQIYKHLLFKTFDMADNTAAYVMACFTQKDELTLDAIPYNKYYQQTEGDLGVKLYNAIEYALYLGAKNVVVIGTDCIELDENILQKAFSELEHHHCVLGPTYDGGYYLIGLKTSSIHLFQTIDWSTDQVLSQTIAALKSKNQSYFLLPKLNDIDTLKDLKKSKLAYFIE